MTPWQILKTFIGLLGLILLMWCMEQKADKQDMIDKHEYSGAVKYNRGKLNQ